jgi:hypothetical protein
VKQSAAQRHPIHANEIKSVALHLSQGYSMKLTRQVRMSVLGGAILMLAGAASAQNHESWIHGNACVGGSAVPSAYGANNPSTASSATVTCPIPVVKEANNTTQQYWLQLAYWNRSTTAGAFTCKVYGLDGSGNKVYDPATVVLPTGAINSTPKTATLGTAPASAQYISVTCTIPKATSGAGGSSFISGISWHIGS